MKYHAVRGRRYRPYENSHFFSSATMIVIQSSDSSAGAIFSQVKGQQSWRGEHPLSSQDGFVPFLPVY